MTQQTAKSRSLILVNHPGRQQRQDFEEIRAKVESFTPEIDVQIADATLPLGQLDDSVWQRPCLVVSFGALNIFRPRRGLIYCCRPIPKYEQLAKLTRVRVPVPLSAQFVFGEQLNTRIWGPLVVLKPTTPGFMSQGAVFLMRTERVVDLAEKVFPSGDPSRRLPVLVQKFVDTGPRPSRYRVLALFGEPLYCRKAYTAQPRPPLDAPDEVLLKAQIATQSGRGRNEAAYDADVLDLARRTYGAMPAIPLHAVDIIREATTNRLFVLEINAGGNTWHFSSTYVQRIPSASSREEKIAQFGAWDLAARVLIKKTMQEAR